MHIASPRRILGPAAVIAALLVAGCHSSGSGAAPSSKFTVAAPPAASIGPTQITTTGLSFPIDAYRATDSEDLSIENAVQVLIAKCAKGFDIDYPVNQRASLGGFGYSRYYGVVDLTTAQKYGYEAPPGLVGGGRGQGGARSSTLTPDDLTVISGWPDGREGDPNNPPDNLTFAGKKVPVGGCSGAADKELGLTANENPADPTVVVNISHAGGNLAAADSRVVQAFAAWSTCMKAQGYKYSSPWDPQDKEWPSVLGSTEINTAVADVTCKQKVNLISIWYGVEVAYEKTLIQQNITALAEEKAHIDEVAAKAAQALSSAGS